MATRRPNRPNRGSRETVRQLSDAELARMTSAELLQAVQANMAADWRASTLPEFRGLLDAEPHTPHTPHTPQPEG